MAENYYYFKFITTEWLTGDIVYEPLSVQGLFINICAVYWQRDGVLTLDDIAKRFKNPPELAELTDRFFSVNDGYISIKFLDEQLTEKRIKSERNSQNGKLGGRPKHIDNQKEKPTANRPLTDRKAKKSKLEIDIELKKEIEYIPALDEFLDYVMQKTGDEFMQIKQAATFKYNAWKENGWRTGENKKIKNWKATILNTIPYLKREQIQQARIPGRQYSSTGIEIPMP